MKTTLVILAAGIGSRFGGGVKQLSPVGPDGELIIDYSIHDAVAAGFNKIIFIIRREIEVDFREVIGDRTEAQLKPLGVEIEYAYQELSDIPGVVPEGRTKPWGTGQAVLACRNLIHEPFAVINADDYYGKDGFRKAADFLKTGQYGLIGYILKNTLSDNGTVTRGICQIEDGNLTGIDETHHIQKEPDGASADGRRLDPESIVSMNFWCYPQQFLQILAEGFPEFLENLSEPLKDEYLLPVICDGLIRRGTEIQVISCDDQWYGMTYREDLESVTESIQELYEQKQYRDRLYGDLVRD